MLKASRGSFEKIGASASGADVYAVKCRKKSYIYAYNPTSEPIARLTLDMAGTRKVRQFDIEKAVFGKAVKIKADGVLEIPVSLAPRSEVLYEIK